MKVSLIFPKEQCYNQNEVNDYLAMRDKFKTWIDFVRDSGGEIECIREKAFYKSPLS